MGGGKRKARATIIIEHGYIDEWGRTCSSKAARGRVLDGQPCIQIKHLKERNAFRHDQCRQALGTKATVRATVRAIVGFETGDKI